MIENSELRNGWAWASVDDLCDLNPRHKAGIPDEREVSFVPMAAVSDSLGEITNSEVRPYREVKSGYTHFAEGDVLWAKITPCMENGKSAVAKGLVNGLACGTTEFFVLRSKGAIIPEFLHFYIRQESYRGQAQRTMKSGVGHARVPKEFLLQTQVPLPPLPEQHRIVAKIEALQERSRKARAALEAIPPLLEQFRQSVLAAAFRGDLTADWRAQHPDVEPASVLLDRIRAERRRRWEEAELAKMQAKGKMPKDEKWKERYKEPEPVDETDLPELPEGWGWTTVEDVSAVVVDCPHSTPSWTEKGRICVRTTEFRPGYLDLNQVRFVSEVTYRKRIERLQPKQGDILYSREGGILGVACIIPPRVELCLGQRMMLLRIEEKLSPRFVMHLLNSPLIQEKVRALTGGSASPHLNVGDVRKLPVPLPSPLEQEHIVRNIEEQLSATSEIGADVAENLELLDQLDQSILAKAFRGELVPQDPNDEPASVLLDRIRTEREAQSAKPRAKKKTLGSTKHTKKAPPVSVNDDDLPLFNSLQK